MNPWNRSLAFSGHPHGHVPPFDVDGDLRRVLWAMAAQGDDDRPSRGRGRGGPPDAESSGPRSGRGGPRGPRGRSGRGPRGAGWGARGGRVQRGDVRAAILALLAEQPRHGYDLMQELSARTSGVWRPSSGSVYPTLSQLEDEGLIVATSAEGKRVFELTDAGRAEAEQREGPDPWDEVNDDVEGYPGDGTAHLMREAALVLAAAKQFRHLASGDQREAAATILADARRKLYGLLASDDTE